MRKSDFDPIDETVASSLQNCEVIVTRRVGNNIIDDVGHDDVAGSKDPAEGETKETNKLMVERERAC